MPDDPKLADKGNQDEYLDKINRSWGTRGDGNETRDRHSTSYDPTIMIDLDLGTSPKPANEYQALMEAAPGQIIEEDQETFDIRMGPLRDALEDEDLLTERERWIIEARFFWRFSVREIADLLPWSVTHVHRIEHQAREKLRKHLENT